MCPDGVPKSNVWKGGLKKDERINRLNVKLLRRGDLLRIESRHGPEWCFFKEETSYNGGGWIISHYIYGRKKSWEALKEHRKKVRQYLVEHPTLVWDKHSLQDMGVIPNSYNDRETYYYGNFEKEAGMGFVPIESDKAWELCSRINALQHGWTKEADDILNEIISNTTGSGYITLSLIHLQSGGGRIQVRGYMERYKDVHRLSGEGSDCVYQSAYTTQCGKNAAFKGVLLWMLEHSKDKKQEEIEKLEKEREKYAEANFVMGKKVDDNEGAISDIDEKIYQLRK